MKISTRIKQFDPRGKNKMELEGWDNEVSDPGDGGTIALDSSGLARHNVCRLTLGTGVETRVLPIPDMLGQELMILLETDGGGTLTITNTDGFSGGATADDVATFADAGDFLLLRAVGTSAKEDWREVVNKGVAIA